MITLLLDSSGPGGIETHVATLAETLQSAGHSTEILLLADHGENAFLKQLRKRGLTHSVNRSGFAGLRRRLAAGQTRLLHAHGYKASILARIAARLARMPLVTTFHAGERAPFPVGLYQRFDEATAFLGETIAVSQAIADRLPAGTALIPNFIRVPDLAEAPERKPRIAFVGRLSPEKAPDRFGAVAETLGPQQASFHFYGDGPMRDALEARFRRHATFHGMVTDAAELWSGVDLLVMPSRAEGLPMAALEAIARGIPVIASDVGGLPDVVDGGRAGWLTPPDHDVAAITGCIRAIKGWLAMPAGAREAMRREAHTHAAARFGAEAALPRILDVYRRAGYAPAIS